LSLLLNIDTATEIASLCITQNGTPLDFLKNEYQKEHASFVHAAIFALLDNTGYKLSDFDAFAVTSGPGSYTGLRVGMATAKGFCYAFSKPLIAINTLEVMTKAALNTIEQLESEMLFCPMIDARRMEVFAAMYNSHLENILAPAPLILEQKLFSNYMKNNKVLFFGSGSKKFREIESNVNAAFADIQHDARHLGCLAEVAFDQKNFSDISYSEPTYFKNFHSISKVN
jgi:tRNA threonylcarbamoyladenosine biosynthesis protein TsaB